MQRVKSYSIALGIILTLLLLSCGEDDTSPTNGSPANNPVADFTWSGSTMAPAVITFTNHSENANHYQWDFDDGGASTEENPVHIFHNAAVYGVMLIAGDSLSGKCDSMTVNITIGKPLGMVLIHAKDQSFQMGSATGSADEMPVHTVSFTHDFWMDTTEVTQGDYEALMSVSYAGYTTPNWNVSYGAGARHPAFEVYWGDAALYCNARSRHDGLDSVYTYTAILGTPGNLCQLEGVSVDFTKNGYRLPTEAKWEYACRAGSSADFFWGKQCDPYPETPADTAEFNSYAVWYSNAWEFVAGDDNFFGTHQVASKMPNAYGLYDMAGNLYEWCNDWYGEYSDGAAVDPTGPASGDWNSVRGGSWGSFPYYLRSANRTFMVPDYQYYFIGFRVVLPVE